MKLFSRISAGAIAGLLLVLASPALAAEPDDVTAFVRDHAAGMDEARVPGFVFVMVDGDGVVVTEAAGSADLAAERPMTVDTPLRVGSISKPVTAALALELAVEGVVDLDEPADRYLDVDLDDRFGPASTIRQLLVHRGGYPDAFVSSHHVDPDDAVPLDEWVRELPDRSTAPDTVASYTSVGYTLAGAALEGAAGAEFADVAEDTLFKPLGMTGATFRQPAPADVAVGYGWSSNGFEAYPLDVPDLVPGAGLVASAADIGRFMTALLDGDGALSAATRSGMLTRVGPEPGLRGYSLGLTEWRYDNRTVLYHGGNGIGTTNRMMILPDEGIGIFTAVNGEAMTGQGDPSPQSRFIHDLHEGLIERFFPGPSAVETATIPFDGSAPATDVTGIYLPTRIDTDGVLRLEGLISQFQVEESAGGAWIAGTEYRGDGPGVYRHESSQIVFVDGPDTVYATRGGTGSYRQVALWETLPFNLVWLVASLVALGAGIVVGWRPSALVLRRLMGLTGGLALGFVGLLAGGMLTAEVMDLFTGVPLSIAAAQAASAAVLVAAAAVAFATWSNRTGRVRAVVGGSLVALAAFSIGSWAWAWGVLPV